MATPTHLFRPIRPPDPAISLATVNDLIDNSTGTWIQEQVREWFYPCDVEQILDISLCRTLPDDVLVWHYTQDGIFTVRSAYHLARNQKALDNASSSGACVDPFWKIIWEASVPPRIKLFGWKIGANALATRSNYAHRVKQTDMRCEICGALEESDSHALFRCPIAYEVWSGSGFDELLWGADLPSARDYFMNAVKILSTEEVGEFLAVMWSSWNLRNNFIYGNDRGERRHHGANARQFVHTYRSHKLDAQEVNIVERNQRWRPPDPGLHKLNFDAGTVKGSCCGWGFVLRNNTCEVLMAGVKQGLHWTNPELEEARACHYAISQVMNKCVTRLIIEGDCQALISKLQHRTRLNNFLGYIISDIVHFFDSFDFVAVSSVRRSANTVAHELANLYLLSTIERLWEDDYPDFIYDLAANDLCNSLAE